MSAEPKYIDEPCPNGACWDGVIFTSEMTIIECSICNGTGKKKLEEDE